MKNYLELIPISARVHRKENRRTILCIMMSVFLVVSIFSMAEMFIRMEREQVKIEYGNWHIMLKDVPVDILNEIKKQKDINFVSQYGVDNFHFEKDYTLDNKKAVICGTEKAFMTEIFNCISEGKFPGNKEVMLSNNTKANLSYKIGDKIKLNTPQGTLEYTISGFCDIASARALDAFFVVMNPEEWKSFIDLELEEKNAVYYIQFKDGTNLRDVISGIKEKYDLSNENVSENTPLLAISGMSNNSFAVNLYLISGALFFIVLIAGTLMISGTINSGVAKRTNFFGMLRCIGMSKKQVEKYVRLEALNWCKEAIPKGTAFGVLVTWIICGIMKFVIGGEFSTIPIFGISIIGIVSGCLVGVISVFSAAIVPAKQAARVSPVVASRGIGFNNNRVNKGIKISKGIKIESLLGIHSAFEDRKKMFLLVGSFSLSIILFMSFSVFLDFAYRAAKSLKSYTPDISIASSDYSRSINYDLAQKIEEKSGVECVYGRMFEEGVDIVSEKGVDKADLISYEDNQFKWAKQEGVKGDLSQVKNNDNCVATVYDMNNPLTLGDKITVKGKECEITCVLSESPFSSDNTPILVCSEKSFTDIVDDDRYSVIDVKVEDDITDEEISEIRNEIYSDYNFYDRREVNREDTATYWMSRILIYAFLLIIAAITVFHIINSIFMNVLTRQKQYASMRAIGMSNSQVIKMIAAEALTYAIIGVCIGGIAGVMMNKIMFTKMVTSYYGDKWIFPFILLSIVIVIAMLAVILAVREASKYLLNQSFQGDI